MMLYRLNYKLDSWEAGLTKQAQGKRTAEEQADV